MSTATRDPYKTLGVDRGASAEEIRRAYRRLARRHHPDVDGDAGAEERSKRISEAYDLLGDPAKRARYDRLAAQGPAAGGFGGHRGAGEVRVEFGDGDLGDLFEAFFGRAATRGGGFGPAGPAGGPERPARAQGRDVDVDLPLAPWGRATVRVVVPGRLTARERELFGQLARTSRFDPRKASR